MDDRELRAMIRESIARHRPASSGAEPGFADRAPVVLRGGAHASHALLPLARGGDGDDGACLIEPAVRCNHCGFCLSFGH